MQLEANVFHKKNVLIECMDGGFIHLCRQKETPGMERVHIGREGQASPHVCIKCIF